MVERVSDVASMLAAAAEAANHRRGLVLAGDRAWCMASARDALAATDLARVVWVSTQPPEGVWALPASRAHSVLGQDVDAVVFDAFSGFDPDAFGAISGTIRGGGLLLLLTPPLSDWPAFADPDYGRIVTSPYGLHDIAGRFVRRLVRVLGEDNAMPVWSQDAGPPALSLPSSQSHPNPRQSGDAHPAVADGLGMFCRTADQRAAAEAVMHVATGRRRRPVVLISDRGRGKSAALGIAAAQLLRTGADHVVVTGPRLDAVERVFEHAHRVVPEARASRAALHYSHAGGDALMAFVPPDHLVNEPRPAGLVLVDEAAAIPAPLLAALLERYARIAFATTIHGYEGTGRGFALRFSQVLDARTPHWRTVRLETPIRWAPADPLERLVFRALLLDAAAADDQAVAGAAPADVTVERVDRDALVDAEATLSELFGLLVLAHYRTRPFDLRLLLDAPNVAVHVMRFKGRVVGTALVATEGGLDPEVAWAIWAGRTRPHGHLIPESLAAHVGLRQAPLARCARIMRIAVHPAVQGRGLGARLVEAVVDQARADGLDYVGTSFGATDDLLRFWSRCQLLPVRVSVTRGAASGAHSVIMLRPLSQAGHYLMERARRRFFAEFPHQLADPARDLEPELAARLLRRAKAPAPEPNLERADWQDLVAFAHGGRVYEVCMGALWKLACVALADPAAVARLQITERDAVIAKALQRRPWSETAEALGVPGRADAVGHLRAAARNLIDHYGDDETRAEAVRMAEAFEKEKQG